MCLRQLKDTFISVSSALLVHLSSEFILFSHPILETQVGVPNSPRALGKAKSNFPFLGEMALREWF